MQERENLNRSDSTVRRTRVAPSPSLTDKFRRFVWGVVQNTFYRWSPVAFHGWRATLLRLFGAEISGGVFIYPTTDVWAPWNLKMETGSCFGPRTIVYSVASVHLGARALVSQGVHLCSATHDHRDAAFPLVIGPITIGPDAWVAADAFVGPGVSIGRGAVVGARGVVVNDVVDFAIVVGSPARTVGFRHISGTSQHDSR